MDPRLSHPAAGLPLCIGRTCPGSQLRKCGRQTAIVAARAPAASERLADDLLKRLQLRSRSD